MEVGKYCVHWTGISWEIELLKERYWLDLFTTRNNYLSNIIIEAAQPSRIRAYFAACVINLTVFENPHVSKDAIRLGNVNSGRSRHSGHTTA